MATDIIARGLALSSKTKLKGITKDGGGEIVVIDVNGNLVPSGFTPTGLSSWNIIQANVRKGLGSTLYPKGTEFVSYKEFNVSAAIGESNVGVTAVSVNEDVFINKIGTTEDKSYVATYDGAVWTKENGEAIELSEYGITITGTPVVDDKIIISDDAAGIVWRVVGHDQYTPVNSDLTHCMTLEMKYCFGTKNAYKGIQFSPAQALAAFPSGLATGPYKIKVDATTYYFTIGTALGESGQIVVSAWGEGSYVPTQIKTYQSPTSTSVVETISLSTTEIAGAVDLGVSTSGAGTTEHVNAMTRARYGNNNYYQSAFRRWVNSDKKLGQYYTPTTEFDRPSSMDTSSDTAYVGFVHGLDKVFVDSVSECEVVCRTNDVFESSSLDGTTFTKSSTCKITDKFFLLSRPEIYGTWDSSSIKDGEMMPFYEGLDNLQRIKRDANGTARIAWLRSCSPFHATRERIVYDSTGAIDSITAYSSFGVCVACNIA